MHGAASVLYRLFRRQYDRIHPAIQWGMTFLFVVIAWVFFRATTMAEATGLLSSMFSFNIGGVRKGIVSAFEMPGGIASSLNLLFMLGWYALSLLACVFAKNTYEKTMAFKPTLFNAFMTVALILYVVLSLSNVSVFLYFNF